MKKRITNESHANSCYFRTTVEKPNRKALIQITEKCNLKCAHCFVSARKYGALISYDDIKNKVLPQLNQAKVISVTLTGGEPMDHPNVEEIVELFIQHKMKVTLCTNGTLISEQQMLKFKALGNVCCNVSLDGFSQDSHGRFRGDRASFDVTVSTIKKLSEHGLLKGILVTPNKLAQTSEYEEICDYAIKHGAKYVLMNPLSSMGRGVISKKKLEAQTAMMEEVKELTTPYKQSVDVVHIRFPNADKPLTACEAGNIIYVFTKGEVTVCPYLVFAADNPNSLHNKDEFIVGNILHDNDIAEKLNSYKYEKLEGGKNKTCNSCSQSNDCGKGCPAGVIASGGKIGDLDVDICPVKNDSDEIPVKLIT